MKIKAYIKNFNGVMDGLLKREELEKVEDPRDADVLLVWQDVRGEYLELAKINKEYLHKPLVVVQHGVGATRDYEHPENFPLLADKFCCWGTHDYERLVKQGNGDKAVITGCPLIKQLVPWEPHDGDKNVIFCPIVTTHEEPANLIVYYELKKAELDYCQKLLIDKKDALIQNWHPSVINPEIKQEGEVPFIEINKNFRLISKLTPIHQKSLYTGAVCQTSVNSSNHIEGCVKLLKQTDVVVGMVESTFQMLAMAMDVPVVICKEWEFKIYGGKDYTHCDHLKTNGATYCELSDLRKVVEQELAHPERLREERKQAVSRELGDVTTDPDENIMKVIKGLTNA